jgi:exonuclease VII small subunit
MEVKPMAFKEQLNKLKDNWLLVALFLVLLVVVPLFSGGGVISMASSNGYSFGGAVPEAMYASKSMSSSDFGDSVGVTDRKITKTAWLNSEIELGKFSEAEQHLKAIVSSTGSYLLNENVNIYDSGKKSYHSGSYTLKVDTKKYDDIVSKLKAIGEVISFSDNAQDITERYVDIKTELGAEKERLKKFEQMYAEASNVADKIQLADRIFSQEKTVKYLEDALKNVDNQVDYSTISVTFTEKRSEYAYIAVTKFSQLINSLVDSFNSLLELVFVILPWAVGTAIVWGAVRLVRRRR